ncbi:MFS transporter [Clostridium sp. KNHs214]|uniref:MFS transporter n=1 Tax=Clostridium sp. KNHs214 TaxID=1540257 RepID=UPI00054CEC42|nr:MFS transporter [Clostridium sp. KNHs214]
MKLNINKKVLAITIINFLYCFAQYVTLPILAVYYNVELGIDIYKVGLLLGIAPIVSAVFGSVCSPVSKKIGNINSLILGIMLITVPYILILFTKNFYIIMILCFLEGFSRVFWEPVIKTLFTYHADNSENKNYVFRLKYITVCLGAILGPFIGMFISKNGRKFNIVCSIFLFFSIILVLILTKKNINTHEISIDDFGSNLKYLKVSTIESVDYKLIVYIIAAVLLFSAFSEFESVFPLALKISNPNIENLFSILLIVNSIGGIILQFIVMYFVRKLNNIICILLGNGFFILAFLMFGISKGNVALLILAVIVFSMGEVLSIPTTDIIVNDIAPDGKKTLYFGLAEFRTLGFSIGPIFSSYILQNYGYESMLLYSILILVISSSMYLAPNVFKQLKMYKIIRTKK